MRKLLCFLPTLTFIIICLGCSDDDKQPEEQKVPEIFLSENELEFPQQGDTKNFYLQSNMDWTLSGPTDWCRVTPSGGKAGTDIKLTVTVDANRTDNDRSVTLAITSGGEQQTLSVTQSLNLFISKTTYQVKSEGEIIPVKVRTTGGYSITIPDKWITRTTPTKALADSMIYFEIGSNRTNDKRTGTVIFTLNAIRDTILFEQGNIWTAPADKTGMESDALILAGKIKIGWNLGNSLEADGGETNWGNPKTTESLIRIVKESGFNAVRIPCNWSNGYLADENNYIIQASWLARVKEVVDYCLNNDMYAIINIHYDGGWLELNPTYAKQEEVNKKQKALWTQIATYFRDYDEHLLFAGTNEVHVEGVDIYHVTEENHEVQQSFNQTFVDAVRATGGRNAYRNLIIQAYKTTIDLAVSKLKLPKDRVTDRLMVEVHSYDPWGYAGETTYSYWGKPYQDFGIMAWGQEDQIDRQFAAMKTSFVDKGYPVILGEYGANRHSLTNENMIESRAYYLEYVTRTAKNNGMVPFYWDNGAQGDGANTAQQFGIFDRPNQRVLDRPALDAIMKGAAEGTYPFRSE